MMKWTIFAMVLLLGCAVAAFEFTAEDEGAYAKSDLDRDWNDPSWNDGVDEGRVSVSDGALRVEYPAGKFGTKETGAQWKTPLSPSDEMFIEYQVFFPDDFDFVKGGKLPGLAGGEANTGSDKPDGTDGWSARIMWRANGRIVQYIYHPDQPSNFGEDFDWGVQFERGRWQTVKTRIVMNTPGASNGVIQSWLDDELVLDVNDLRLRTQEDLTIDVLYFSTFFGGSDDSWATSKDEYVLFDDFRVWPAEDTEKESGDEQPKTSDDAVILTENTTPDEPSESSPPVTNETDESTQEQEEASPLESNIEVQEVNSNTRPSEEEAVNQRIAVAPTKTRDVSMPSEVARSDESYLNASQADSLAPSPDTTEVNTVVSRPVQSWLQRAVQWFKSLFS